MSNDILMNVLKNATKINVPLTNHQVSLVKQKNDSWRIISHFGPAWYWSKNNAWIISLADNVDENVMEFVDVVEAFNVASKTHTIKEQKE